ncbi:MarR family winged helix-turn-helix transcriptional regulator [Marinoscillum pacificum]|uniref:MarR family winged helix-turn-helix transcriptional regulator n=1 Tax=Marinoscillum pacificum TaxID=392723 RepID=UPI0021573C59|nr:MarR family transcriptional regulator [Marinoscillum pacificum]
MSSSPKELWLENQLCFPLYAVSRLMTKQYTPLLEELDITYPQYLVLLVLWQKDDQLVSDISKRLLLESNTLTPLLKRLEQKQLVKRVRQESDERKVLISLTNAGKELQNKAVCIPERLVENIKSEDISAQEVEQMMTTIHKLISTLATTSERLS